MINYKKSLTIGITDHTINHLEKLKILREILSVNDYLNNSHFEPIIIKYNDQTHKSVDDHQKYISVLYVQGVSKHIPRVL